MSQRSVEAKHAEEKTSEGIGCLSMKGGNRELFKAGDNMAIEREMRGGRLWREMREGRLWRNMSGV